MGGQCRVFGNKRNLFMDNAGCELNLELQGLERITYERSDEKACVQVNHPPRASLRAGSSPQVLRSLTSGWWAT